jgi:nitrate/nitrite transport system substrate-binding protein
MSFLDQPYSGDNQPACSCGTHATQAEHDAAQARDRLALRTDPGQLSKRALEVAALRGLFPNAAKRRQFLRAVGASTAAAAVAEFLPLGALAAMAQDRKPLERKELKIGFIPITCSTPLIMADPLNFYKNEGLEVTLVKTAGWALIRDKMMNKEYDASHMLAPMPLAISLGVGSVSEPMNVATIQNINGQAITLSLKHKDRRDPKLWKGMTFAVPFEFSMHNFLLRYYVAEHGLDPDKDIQIRVTPPPEMVANLRAGNIDGFLGPDPFNQRAVYDEVGFIHILSKELWDGHPCCAFGVRSEWVMQNPNTFAALYRAVVGATAMAHDPKNRQLIAKVIAPASYLNQPVPVLEQVLTGRYADGLGNIKNEPNRIDFEPFPWASMAVWMLTQMRRWGYIKQDIDYKVIAEKIFLVTDARKRMAEMGQSPPKDSYKTFKVMGKEFDASKAAAYAKSFAISKIAG